MKKRTLLTFVATSAVVMTTAASYAVWDVTRVSEAVTITTGKGITVSSNDLNFTGTLADSASGTTEIESDLTISVDGDTAGKKLQFTTSDMTLDGTVNTSAVIVKVMENTTDVTANGDDTVSPSNTYKVKVALPSNSTAEAYANKTINFNLNAELVAK